MEGIFQGAVRVGSRLPAHATVLGRALLQDMDADQLRELFGGSELPQFSESTPRDVQQLQQLLLQDRRGRNHRRQVQAVAFAALDLLIDQQPGKKVQ